MIVDLVIIAIIAICLFVGYKKGLIKVAFKLVSLVIAILIAILLHGPVSNFVINNTDIYNQVENVVAQNINPSKFTKGEETKKEEAETSQIWIDYINDAVQETANNTKERVEDAAIEKITTTIINIAIIIIIFILVKIILSVLSLILDLISKLPIIDQFNKTGGIIFGFLEGLLIVYILLAICLVASSFMEGTGVIEAINNSYIGKMLYNNNILLKFI